MSQRRTRSKNRVTHRTTNTVVDGKCQDAVSRLAKIVINQNEVKLPTGTGRPRGRPRKRQVSLDEPQRVLEQPWPITYRKRLSTRKCSACPQECKTTITRCLRPRKNRPTYTNFSPNSSEESSEESDHIPVSTNYSNQKQKQKPLFLHCLIQRRPNDRVIRSPSPSSEDDISLRLSEVGSSINCQQNENNIVRGSPTNQSPTSTTEIPLSIPQTSSPPPTINPLQANPSVPLPLPNDVISLSNSAPFLGQAQDSEKQCCTSSMSTLENFNQERMDEVNKIKPENDLKVGPEPEIRVVLEYVHDVDQDLLRTRFRIKFYIDDENTTTDRSEILMFEIGLSGPNMYENLCHELLNSFPNLVGKKFIIYYRDSENDLITVSNSRCLETALKIMQNHAVVKFHVKVCKS